MSTPHNVSVISTPLQFPSPPVYVMPPVITVPQEPEALRNLIVNYLPPLMDETQLAQLFSQFGSIESVKIIYDWESGESRGYGFVKYHHFFSATYAIACLNRFRIGGKTLKVAYANAEAAREAHAILQQTATGFTSQQQVALQALYYHQMILAHQQGATEVPPAMNRENCATGQPQLGAS